MVMSASLEVMPDAADNVLDGNVADVADGNVAVLLREALPFVVPLVSWGKVQSAYPARCAGCPSCCSCR